MKTLEYVSLPWKRLSTQNICCFFHCYEKMQNGAKTVSWQTVTLCYGLIKYMKSIKNIFIQNGRLYPKKNTSASRFFDMGKVFPFSHLPISFCFNLINFKLKYNTVARHLATIINQLLIIISCWFIKKSYMKRC